MRRMVGLLNGTVSPPSRNVQTGDMGDRCSETWVTVSRLEMAGERNTRCLCGSCLWWINGKRS
jgi:hypothetical protein